MIKAEVIKRARSNDRLCLKVYNKVFYDGSVNKVKRWLYKKGVREYEIDELESQMNVAFFKTLYVYDYDKIDFEKFVWIKFKQVLINHYHRKREVKKIANIISFEGYYDEDDELMKIDDKKISIGYISENDNLLKSDFDNIVSDMTDIQALICKLRFYNKWTEKEVINHLKDIGVPKREYLREMNTIKLIIKKYFIGEL